MLNATSKWDVKKLWERQGLRTVATTEEYLVNLTLVLIFIANNNRSKYLKLALPDLKNFKMIIV